MKCNRSTSIRDIDSVFNNISNCVKILKRINDSAERRQLCDSVELLRNISYCASLIRRCDRMFADDRGKRAKKWPGRATNWEIRAVLGWSEKAPVERTRINGEVDAQGGVRVYEFKNGKKYEIGYKSGPELDNLAMTNKIQYGVSNFGNARPQANMYANPNGDKSIDIANGLNALAKVASLSSQIVMTLGAIKAGYSGIKTFAKTISETAKGLSSKVAKKISELHKAARNAEINENIRQQQYKRKSA